MTKLLTPTELAARWRVAVGTLAQWRHHGRGPRFVKPGRTPLYPLVEVERFERDRTFRRSGERAP